MARSKTKGLSDKVKERMARLKGNIKTGGGGGKLFLRTKGVDDFCLRILPVDLENEDPFLEVGNHWIGGNNDGKGFNCPQVLSGKDCPLCHMSEYLAEVAETDGEEKLARALKVRKRAYFKVIDRENEDDGIRVWQAPITAAEQLLDIMGKRGDITDPEDGRDFDVSKSEGKNGFTEYKVVQDDSSSLSEDEKQQTSWIKESNKIDVRKLVPVDVKGMMEAAEKAWPNLDFEYDESDHEDDEDDEEPDNFKKKSPKKSRKPEPEVAEDEDEEDSDDTVPFTDSDLSVGDEVWYENSRNKRIEGKIVKEVDGETFKIEKDADGRKVNVKKAELHAIGDESAEDQDEEADEPEEEAEEEAPVKKTRASRAPKKKAESWEEKYNFPDKQLTVKDLEAKKSEIPECFEDCGIHEDDESCLECPISKECFKKTFPDQVEEDDDEADDESDDVMKSLKGRRKK
jgi:hypothetical protein